VEVGVADQVEAGEMRKEVSCSTWMARRAIKPDVMDSGLCAGEFRRFNNSLQLRKALLVLEVQARYDGQRALGIASISGTAEDDKEVLRAGFCVMPRAYRTEQWRE
jgi:hypothetical protein